MVIRETMKVLVRVCLNVSGNLRSLSPSCSPAVPRLTKADASTQTPAEGYLAAVSAYVFSQKAWGYIA